MFEDQANEEAEFTQADVGVDEEAAADDVHARLAAETARADENHDKYLLAVADFENYKRRMQRDIASTVTSHRRSLLERFLPVIDNLERALQYDAGSEALRGGVERTLKGFEAILASQDVHVIDVVGKPFDPHIAEAIGTVVPTDDTPEDTVVEVAQKGYAIGQDLLRPARVLVAKSPA